MNHKKHESFGIILWIIFLIYLLLNHRFAVEQMVAIAVVSFLFCFIGSTLPDIDNKNSRVFKKTKFLITAVTFIIAFMFFSRYFGRDLMSILYLIGASALFSFLIILLIQYIIPRHRGPIHSFKTGFIYGILVLILSYFMLGEIQLALLIAFFAFLSFASHLALDQVLK